MSSCIKGSSTNTCNFLYPDTSLLTYNRNFQVGKSENSEQSINKHKNQIDEKFQLLLLNILY